MTAVPALGARARQPDDHERGHAHPLDAFVVDPTGLTPLCDEPEFAEILEEMVADEAPRLFAVVQEHGEHVNCRIAAWGMAFADHADVVSVGRTRWMSVKAPENALRLFTFGSHIRARLVWFNPDAATAPEDEDGSV